MVDTCTIRRVTGESMNATTLAMTPTYSTVYTGRCRVQLRDAQAANPDAGEHGFVVGRTIVQVPVSATGVQINDEVVLSASVDADLVGRVLRVRGLFHKTHASARRLECEEVQA